MFACESREMTIVLGKECYIFHIFTFYSISLIRSKVFEYDRLLLIIIAVGKFSYVFRFFRALLFTSIENGREVGRFERGSSTG